MSGDVRVRVTADVSSLRQGMEAATQAVKGVQQNMGRAQGAANLLGGAIETLGGTSGATGKALGAMLGGFAGGGLIGLAIGGVQALVGAMRSASEAAEKATGEWKKHIDALDKGTESLRDKLLSLKGMDPELHKMQVELVALQRAMPKEEDIADPAAFAAAKARYNELLGKIKERQAALKAVADEEKRQADAKEAAKAAAKAEADKAQAAKDAAKERERLRLEEAKRADLIAKGRVEEALQAEQDWAEGLALIEKQKAERAAKAAAAAEKEQKEAAKEEKSDLKDVQASGEQAAAAMGQAFGSIFDQGLSQADIFKRLILQLASTGIGMAFPGGGFVSSFLGGILGGRASGGPVQAGQPYVVGEKRPELFVPNQSGTILPEVPSAGGAINLTIQALDGASVERTLIRNHRALKRAMRRATR